MSLLDCTPSYRPVIGFEADCTICGLPVLRYGRVVHDNGQHGMPAALIPAEVCHGHAVMVPRAEVMPDPSAAELREALPYGPLERIFAEVQS